MSAGAFPGISGNFREFPGIRFWMPVGAFPGISGHFQEFPGISGNFREFGFNV